MALIRLARFRIIILILAILCLLTAAPWAWSSEEYARRFGAYVKMPSVGFSLVCPYKEEVVGYMVISPAFEAINESRAQFYVDRLFLIQNAIIQDMNAYLSLFWSPSKPVNGNHIVQVMKGAVKRVMGKDVKKVYVHEIEMNRAGKEPTL